MSTKNNSENAAAAENSLKPEESDRSKFMPMENREDWEEAHSPRPGAGFGISRCPRCHSEMKQVNLQGPTSTYGCFECGYTNKDGSTSRPLY